jgi:hypothetical protein
MEWLQKAQDRNQWWALVNTGMKLRVPKKVGKFLTSLASNSFSDRICSMEILLTHFIQML